MKVEIKVPQMGESVNEATIAALLVESGQQVEMDQEILELETDKVNQVLTAPRAGKIEITVKVDDTVTIGQVVGSVDTEAAGAAPAPKAKEETSAEPEPKPEPPKEAPAPTEGRARYMPEEFVQDLGRDEERAAPPSPPKKEAHERESRERLSKIRQIIARRLLESQESTAMLTTFNEIDMSAVIAARKTYQEAFVKKHGIKLGFMSWFVKGCVHALQEVSGVNSYIDGNEIVRRNYYDIGVAVGTPRGLMVPVLRDYDQMSFAQIEQQIKSFAEKARSGQISPDDLQGGGFTITNGGIYGSLLSTPIVNPPQSGILGMHKIMDRAIVVDGQIEVRPMMYTALSYDHRVVDGQEAVTFLVKLKQVLEDPTAFLLEL